MCVLALCLVDELFVALCLLQRPIQMNVNKRRKHTWGLFQSNNRPCRLSVLTLTAKDVMEPISDSTEHIMQRMSDGMEKGIFPHESLHVLLTEVVHESLLSQVLHL